VHNRNDLWLVARRGGGGLAAADAGVPWLVTVQREPSTAATRGLGRQAPQAHIHGVERRMVRDADHVITWLALTCAAHVADVLPPSRRG